MRRSLALAILVLATIPAAASAVTVTSRHDAAGTHLATGSGLSLYVFDKDTGKASHCTGSCASSWRPLVSKTKPHAGGSARKRLLSRHTRADGGRQVLYGGHPLYTFVGDSAPGQTTGQSVLAFGAYWWLIGPSAAKLER
jgi:predicted lipoprotein with Yx(FWY)xxD motif